MVGGYELNGTTVIDSTRRARMSVLLPTDTTLYATDASLSYFSSSNAVYLNGAGANGWLRLNASGNANDRTAINLFGQNAGDNITFKTASSERMRLASNGDWVVSNTNPRVASQFTNQAGMGWYDADLHAEIATTGNRSALELGRNNSTATGDFLVFRKQATVIGSIGVEGGDSLYIQSTGSGGGGLRFHSTGRISPVRNGALANNVIDLGASTQQFANLYLGTGLYVSGSQVINSIRNLTNIGTGSFSGKLTINNANYANHLELVRGSDTLYLTPSGGQLITNGGLSPDVTNQDDLGRSDKYWQDLWLGTSLKMGGTTVINSSRALTNITGLTLSSSTSSGMKSTFTDSTADASFYGFHIDYNASGSDTTTADRLHAGLYIDADSSASGGGTSHEHRFYGAYITATASGDSDIIDGAFMQGRADNFGTGNQVTYLRGNNAMALAHHDRTCLKYDGCLWLRSRLVDRLRANEQYIRGLFCRLRRKLF